MQRIWKSIRKSFPTLLETSAVSKPTSMIHFEQFTDEVGTVAVYAYDTLQHHKHIQVDTVHMFLSLLNLHDKMVCTILEKMDVNIAELKYDLVTVLNDIPRSDLDTSRQVVYITPRLKLVMDHAIEESKALHEHYASTEHVLLGISREHHSTRVGQILIKYAISTERIHEILQQIRGSTSVGESIQKETQVAIPPTGVDPTPLQQIKNLLPKLSLADKACLQRILAEEEEGTSGVNDIRENTPSKTA